jgi:hypothetical protein
MIAGREKDDEIELMNKLEDSYYKTMFFVKKNLVKYAHD